MRIKVTIVRQRQIRSQNCGIVAVTRNIVTIVGNTNKDEIKRN